MSESPSLFGDDPAAGYVVLARKYRPKTFADLIGQEAMVRTIANSFALGRVPHAYMLTGVRGVHVRSDGWQTSDLAVAAARRALEQSPGAVDLLVFASASQDLIEPATAHIVAAKLGVAAPVMDVKNACNSLLQGMQVAEALIATGQARRALVVSGEQPSHAVRWRLEGANQFLRAFPGYTMSDGGAAVVLEASDRQGVGLIGSRFAAHSEYWSVGTLPTGGSVNLVTKTPTLDQSFDGSFGIGSHNFKRGTLDFNQPLTDFVVPGSAFRFNAMWTESEIAGRDKPYTRRWGIAPSLVFGLGTDTQLTLTYSHLEQDNLPDYGIPWINSERRESVNSRSACFAPQ